MIDVCLPSFLSLYFCFCSKMMLSGHCDGRVTEVKGSFGVLQHTAVENYRWDVSKSYIRMKS